MRIQYTLNVLPGDTAVRSQCWSHVLRHLTFLFKPELILYFCCFVWQQYALEMEAKLDQLRSLVEAADRDKVELLNQLEEEKRWAAKLLLLLLVLFLLVFLLSRRLLIPLNVILIIVFFLFPR